MDFLIGFIAGLFIGGWVGLGIASAIVISRDKETEARMNGDPDGSKAVLDETIEALKCQKHNSRLDDDTWKEDMERDARQYEAGE